jgi:hypothetical protein
LDGGGMDYTAAPPILELWILDAILETDLTCTHQRPPLLRREETIARRCWRIVCKFLIRR